MAQNREPKVHSFSELISDEEIIREGDEVCNRYVINQYKINQASADARLSGSFRSRVTPTLIKPCSYDQNNVSHLRLPARSN